MDELLKICFEDVGQLKEDLGRYLESWQRTVRVGDKLTLIVVQPIMGQKK